MNLWSSCLWCMSSFLFRTIDQPFILPEEYNSVLESWMWLSKFSHSCSKIIFGCWHFKAATKTFFLSISVDVIRPVFREQKTKTWMESGRRKNCGNMSTACREIAIFGLKLTTEAVLLTHCNTPNAARWWQNVWQLPDTPSTPDMSKKERSFGVANDLGRLHILRTTQAQPSVTQYLIFMKLKRTGLIRTAGKTIL